MGILNVVIINKYLKQKKEDLGGKTSSIENADVWSVQLYGKFWFKFRNVWILKEVKVEKRPSEINAQEGKHICWLWPMSRFAVSFKAYED